MQNLYVPYRNVVVVFIMVLTYLVKFILFQYDVTRDDGVPGSGGEYDVQKGFGWTNGVVLALLDTYGEKLSGRFEIKTQDHFNLYNFVIISNSDLQHHDSPYKT